MTLSQAQQILGDGRTAIQSVTAKLVTLTALGVFAQSQQTLTDDLPPPPGIGEPDPTVDAGLAGAITNWKYALDGFTAPILNL